MLTTTFALMGADTVAFAKRYREREILDTRPFRVPSWLTKPRDRQRP